MEEKQEYERPEMEIEELSEKEALGGCSGSNGYGNKYGHGWT